ncbi:hypothetical protein [Salimicrobium flavidum]|uniref:Uncharacterized protein n=1 Tax=Salimicrobium flavidum TaxID=570947 RepID=A0A1N7KP82_9BACI|nr:hypothetical protein [Salimicrobium flavidum]SIS63270.1 hypothetical protein SAMN05421687_1155 [Salimicrobium flavidum]
MGYKEEIDKILDELKDPRYHQILKDILEEEKKILNRKDARGSGVLNRIEDIVKERIQPNDH